jgi:hypothetical protein
MPETFESSHLVVELKSGPKIRTSRLSRPVEEANHA